MNEASHVKQIKQRANCQCSLSKLHIMSRRSDSQMQMEQTAPAKPWQCGRGKLWCWCPLAGRSYLRYALCLQQSNQLQTSMLASASTSASESALALPVKMDPPERQKHDLYKWYRLCSEKATHWRRRRRQLISDSSNNNNNNNNIKTAMRLHEKMKGVWGVLKAVAVSLMLLLSTCLHYYCCYCYCSGVGGAVW